MTSAGDSKLGTMENQPARKQGEWKKLQTLRVNPQEGYLEKAQEEHRQEELSPHCLPVAKPKEHRATEAKQEKLKEFSKCQHEAARHRLQPDNVKRSMTGKIQKQAKEYERTKLDVESRIQVLEEKLNLQRQEMTAAFDSELRQREHEFNLKTNEMHVVLLSHNLKVKLLSKKTEIYYQAYLQAIDALKASKVHSLQIQALLHQRDQEVKDLTDVKDKNDLHTKMKDAKINTLQERETKLKTELDKSDLHTKMKDAKINTLQERENKLKTELERSKEAIDRYKQQVSDGLKRERTLEQMQVQMELEWQRRCEDIKAKHYLATEQLIQGLTQARDQAEAELKEKKQELQDLTERDQAIQDSTSEVNVPPLEKIRLLQEQNSILRAAVTQMRKDIENLSHLTQPQHSVTCATQTSPVTTGPLHQPTNGSSKQLQEASQRLCHHQASGLLSAGLFANAQNAKNNPTLMRTRLRQAASCIARLCRDKQQLIEMANRLRAQFTATGPQESVEKDSSTKQQGKKHDQHEQLSSLLGKLQHQLTSQELQYALRPQAGTINQQLLPGTINPAPSTDETSFSRSQGHKTARSENTLNTQPRSGLPRSQMSSAESLQSLKEFLEELDLQHSSSFVSEE